MLVSVEDVMAECLIFVSFGCAVSWVRERSTRVRVEWLIPQLGVRFVKVLSVMAECEMDG